MHPTQVLPANLTTLHLPTLLLTPGTRLPCAEGQEGTTAAAGAAAANGGSVTHAPLPGAVPWQAAADTGAGAGAEAEACAEPGEEPAQTIGGLGRQAGLGLKQGLQDEPHVSWQQAQQEQQQELEEQEQQGEGQQEDTEVIDLVNDSGTASEKLQQQHQQAGGGGGAATRRQRRRRRPAAVMADEARQSAVRQDAQVGLLLQHAARQKQPFTPGKRAEPPRSGQRPAAAKRPAPAMRLPAMPAARTPSAHKAPTLSLQQEQPPQGGTKAAAAAAPALGEACGHSLASLREEAKTLVSPGSDTLFSGLIT